MKHKVYGITYANIHGLNSNYQGTDSKNIWKISFKYEEHQLPFDSTLQVVLYYTYSQADEQLSQIKETFKNNNIRAGDKVAVIYDVVNGNVIAIGRNRHDHWIKVINFKVVPFSGLGIRNCSFIPMFY